MIDTGLKFSKLKLRSTDSATRPTPRDASAFKNVFNTYVIHGEEEMKSPDWKTVLNKRHHVTYILHRKLMEK